MDPSKAMIEEAERITNETNIDNIMFMESSAEKLADVEDGTADCIVSGEAAHWFDMNKVRTSKVCCNNGLISEGVARIRKVPSFGRYCGSMGLL